MSETAQREREEFRAYYFSLFATGCEPIDNILRWIARAGKAFHSTSYWDDQEDGASYVDRIQEAADQAAAALAPPDAARAALEASGADTGERGPVLCRRHRIAADECPDCDTALSAGEREDGAEEGPPCSLGVLADWFDNPNESPTLVVHIGGRPYTPGYLLRRIDEAFDATVGDGLNEDVKEE